MDDASSAKPAPHRSHLERWGSRSWNIVGIALAVIVVFSAIAALSGIVVPLVFAVVVAALGVPVVDRLERHGIPRSIGALGLIAVLTAVIIGAVVILIHGVIQEGTDIKASVTAGTDEINTWLEERDIGVDDPPRMVDAGTEQGRRILTGAASVVSSAFTSVMSFAIGLFLALFMLYYILKDWARARAWLAGHLGVPREMGEAIIDDATQVVRRGFGALTLTSLITSTLIGLAMVMLDLPLALTVAVVTFVTSYVPYLGAIVSGAFGFLVALGDGGVNDALILLAVIIVVQNIVQTIVGNQLTSASLSLHPLPSLISSVFGVVIAGIVGAILSAPALALAIAVSKRVRSTKSAIDDPDAAVPSQPAG